MKLTESEKDGVYSFTCEFADDEVKEFIKELKKRPRLMAALYEDLVKSGKMTPHGET